MGSCLGVNPLRDGEIYCQVKPQPLTTTDMARPVLLTHQLLVPGVAVLLTHKKGWGKPRDLLAID